MRTNLRARATRFVGRAVELERLAKLIGEGRRLITISGPAGTGKSRLAEELGLRAQDFGQGGVWLCDLVGARGLDGIGTHVARTLTVPLSPGVTGPELIESLGHALAARGPILVILDTFEHLVEEATATIAAWLVAAPDLRVLVTSREHLRLEGEVRFELPPLALPAKDGDIESSDAVQLFVDRVRTQDPAFVLDDRNAGTVADVVRSLEGIPLAIELAASRVDVFGLHGLLERLSQRLEVLGHGSRDADARHTTLRAAVDWSWSLLDEAERSVLAQCAVFRAGFTDRAAESVLRVKVGSPLGVIENLRTKSLIRTYEPEEWPGSGRFGLYEAIREFAGEQLETRDEVQARHAHHYVESGKAWAAGVDGHDGRRCVRHLALERENLKASLEHALEQGAAGVEPAGHLVLSLDALASIRGPSAAHARTLEHVAELASTEQPDAELTAAILRARGTARLRSGQYPGAERDLEHALAISERLGHAALQASVMVDLGMLELTVLEQARERYAAAIAHARQANDRRTEGRALGNLGALHHDLRHYDDARSHYHDALALLQEVGDQRREAIHVANLGVLEQERGELPRARAHFETALELLAALGDPRLEAIVLGNLGALEHEEGRPEQARTCHERALAILREAGDRRSEALSLGRLGRVLAELGWSEDADACITAADRLLGRFPNELAREAVGVDRGFLELAAARKAHAGGDTEAAERNVAAARKRIASVREPGPEGRPPWSEQSDDVRAAVRILESGLGKLAGSTPIAARSGAFLMVEPEAKWFRAPKNDKQDLSRRKALRLILKRLVEHQRQNPGAGLTLEQLLEAGWPGERVMPSAGANRVYVALTTLRKLGLRGYLLSQDDGYLLDPALPVERML